MSISSNHIAGLIPLRLFVLHSRQLERRFSVKRFTFPVIFAFIALFGSMPAWAHHSPSSIFDMTKKLTFTGTLTQVEWVNPHIAIYVDIKKQDGTNENWKFESAPPSWLRRVGINSADFKKQIGQAITIEGNRAKDGTAYGFLQKVTFANGNSYEMVNPNAIDSPQ